MTTNTPQETLPFTPSVSVESVTGLTEAQKTELRTAQETAIRATTGDKLTILKQNLSQETQKTLQDKGIDLQWLVKEQTIVNKGLNAMWNAGESVSGTVKNGMNQAEWFIKKYIPWAAALMWTVETADEGVSMWKKFWDDPKAMFGELWNAIVASFKSMSLEPLSKFFSPGATVDGLKSGIKNLIERFDLSLAVKESWEELLIDVKEFRNITLENLQKHKDLKPAEIIVKLKLENAGISENDLKNFIESFFKTDNFEKLQTILKNAGKTTDEIPKMTLAEILNTAK